MVRWRFLLTCVLVIVGQLVLYVLFPPGPARPEQTTQISWLQLGLTYIVMFFSMVTIASLEKRQIAGRQSWIGVHSGVLAIGFISTPLLPQWCGLITASAYALLVLTPNVLNGFALRRLEAGRWRAAASYGRVVRVFHPSERARFQSSFLSAQALESIEQKVAAYQSLAPRATPEEFANLNRSILIAQDDWMGVLAQVRSAGDAKQMVRLEIRALGELGRVEEMAMTYAMAVAESVVNFGDVFFCRLFVLAFTGRVDAVHSLLSRQLRSLSSERKAYWTFIACQAAGAHDEEARRHLQSAADAADDETFRRAARRHLDASLVGEETGKTDAKM